MAIAQLQIKEFGRIHHDEESVNDTRTLPVSTEHITSAYDSDTASLWLTLHPEGVPCFTLELLREMASVSAQFERAFHRSDRRCNYMIIRSGTPNVFNLGGDLASFQDLIQQQSRARLAEYANASVDVAYRNYTGHGVPDLTTIALLEGDALGGGFESALSCDIVVAEKHIKAGFPEVLFNMFPGMGGISFLSRRVGRKVVNDLTTSGRLYSAQELFDLGVVDQVVDTGSGVEAVQRLVRQRQPRLGAHAAMLVVDKLLRPVDRAELDEVVNLWVDRALALTPRGLDWMRRLSAQQAAAFPKRRAVALAA